MNSNGYHYKGQGLDLKNRGKRPSVEVFNGFKLTYRPVTELRGGLSGTSQMGFNPATGKVDQMGNPIMYPAGRFQTDGVVIEDMNTGEQMDVVDNQEQAHRVCRTILDKRARNAQPKPQALPGRNA